MRRRGFPGLTACAVVASLCLSAGALEQNPVARFDAAGGQIFFKDFTGTSDTFVGSAAGSADYLLGDGLKLDDDDTLIPTVSGQYMRRDQVNQIGGGGTLVSQTMDNSAAVRWVHKIGDWSIKPNADYKSELVVSLPGDSIGSGFFDLGQTDVGLSAEWQGETVKSVRQSFSFTDARYYHYQAARSPLFGEELLTDNRNLDTASYTYSVAADVAAWKDGLVTGTAEAATMGFGHQRLFEPDSTGGTGAVETSGTRRDWLGTLLLGASQRWTGEADGQPWEALAGLNGGYVLLSSNQNDFDAGQSIAAVQRFNPNFYSYREYSLGPLVTLSWAKVWKGMLGYNFAHRDYVDRPVQDALGYYLGGRVDTDTHTVSYSLSYLIGRGWSAQFSGGYVMASANTSFEKFYLYNYSYPFYFLGFGWAL